VYRATRIVVILGIDPGTTSIGYALLESGVQPRILDAGLIQIKKPSTEDRLVELHRELIRLIQKWHPDLASVERLFFTKNQKTALAVAQARGVILLTIRLAGIMVYEYTPLEVKKSVTGYGKTDKIGLSRMIRLTLPDASKIKARDDVFDAMAVALTCYFNERKKKYI